jgi:Arc/MetJ-type ribon-helix-helix transcriptional regulator
MTIQLTPEQERIIQAEIESGHFRNADEVVDHALSALGERVPSAPTQPLKDLLTVLKKPPFAGSELDLERQRDYPRPLDL